ncbi:unnamed protein product, partial [marine sediment metagenome]
LEEAAFSINQLGKNMAEHAYFIGEILCWIKPQLKHGEFMDWIEANVWFKRSTAGNFMVFARKCNDSGFLLEQAHYLESAKLPKFGNIETPELPAGKFNVLYADPPWQYSNTGFRESAEHQYSTMPVEEICALPIQELITDKAVLFLWVTNAFINEGLQVCEAWNFSYKTNFVWIKNRGQWMGWFSRGKHELLFIATRGEGMHPRERPDSYFEAKIRKHSLKIWSHSCLRSTLVSISDKSSLS